MQSKKLRVMVELSRGGTLNRVLILVIIKNLKKLNFLKFLSLAKLSYVDLLNNMFSTRFQQFNALVCVSFGTHYSKPALSNDSRKILKF